MDNQLIFNFKTDISEFNLPLQLNNPFGLHVPEIAKIAATEFQTHISSESSKWNYDFHKKRGKMFGVLVIQQSDYSYNYLGAVSGKLPACASWDRLVPSVFDESAGDFFINKGMTELTEIGNKIKKTINDSEINTLKEIRKLKSIALQQRLFEHYRFVNLSGTEKNLIDIFKESFNRIPPSAAGECAAPKLLQYAITNKLKPIALSEFWWGGSIKYKDKEHCAFYPACTDKCRPILEYMLEDSDLYIKSTDSSS